MKIPPNQTFSSIAGANRAARRGGESEKQANELARTATHAQAPAGKPSDTPSIDEGDHTRDRNGDGRQMFSQNESQTKDIDQFELSENETLEESPSNILPTIDNEEPNSHIDFEA